MKQCKKLTYMQKNKMSKKGFDATKYVLLSEDKDTFTVIEKGKENDDFAERLTFAK